MIDVNLLEDEFLDDVEIYEGEPDWPAPMAIDDAGSQDDDTDVPEGLGFMARATNAIRTWREALDWYKTHQTEEQIGFDPDGMCLKVCRTPRNIPAKYQSAKEAQDATPEQFRVHSVADLRRSMFLFFDDPNDSNRFGHIVTMVGRARGYARGDLDGVLVETNSVVSGELVIVRASYFVRHWGDSFKFGATWLNGVEIDVPDGGNNQAEKLEKFDDSKPRFDMKILDRMAKNGNREIALIRDLIDGQVRRLPDSPKLERVREFKEAYRADRELRMMLLNEYIKDRPNGLVQRIRDEIRRLINELPDE